MAGSELILEVKDSIATITLNRPERRNSLSVSLLLELTSTIKRLEGEGTVRCAILKGAGEKAFCAGMDLASLAQKMPDELLAQITEKGPLPEAVETMEAASFPLIAMVRGYALGAGLELAMGCDLRVGSEESCVGMPPARLGIVYAPEGLARFISNIGLAQAKKLFFTGRYVGGREAYEMGVLQYLVAEDQLDGFTSSLAEEVAGRAPLAVSGIKKSLNILGKGREPDAQERAMMNDLMERAATSRDAVEALAAFAQKRRPEFRGE